MSRLLTPFLLLAACGGSADVPDTYSFDGRTGEGSVVHTGQTLRQVLIDDMKGYLGGLTSEIDGGLAPEAGDVRAELDFFWRYDGDSAGEVEHGIRTDLDVTPSTYGQVGSGNLIDKIAGNDEVGQHVDWSTAFVGWEQEGVSSPQSLVEVWMDEVDAAAVARASGDIPLGPDGAPVASVYVSEDGRDRLQLLEKFLRVSIAFSQAADDYLDDDTEGKGLLSDHTELDEGKTYTPLEHQWDEGFGYFGASQDYGLRAPADIAEIPWSDADGDGTIDLATELTFGHAGNAAKRDVGAISETTFSADAFEGFVAGRALLDRTDGALSDAELEELQGYRDQALLAWEKAIASTAVHYINDTLQDMAAFDSDAYDFGDHAKHWSELKGFALGMQFNPRSPLSDADFARLHELIGDEPTLPTASPEARAAYAQALLDARDLLGEAYDFDAANLGDDEGQNGW